MCSKTGLHEEEDVTGWEEHFPKIWVHLSWIATLSQSCSQHLGSPEKFTTEAGKWVF